MNQQDSLYGEHHYKFIDIGSNLGDPIFRGIYYGKQVHTSDFDQILSRSRLVGVKFQILTGDSLSGSREVYQLTKQHSGLYSTVGCHPCKAYEFESIDQTKSIDSKELEKSISDYMNSLEQLIIEDRKQLNLNDRRIVAVGECGLDYDRFSYCTKEIQLKYFPIQLELSRKYQLPLFLHSRHPEAHIDMIRILKNYNESIKNDLILSNPRKKGVIHSFTGTISEMEELVELGFSIGVNGCSLKTEDNLEVVKAIPLDRLMLETDCPWCEVRKSHASYRYLEDIPKELNRFESIKKEKVEKNSLADPQSNLKLIKGRNEPCTIGQIAWIVSKLHQVDLSIIIENAYKNTIDMFGIEDIYNSL